MIKRILALGLLSLTLFSGACAERIDPGYVGIKVNFYGDDKGVANAVAVTGMNWYNPITTSIYSYPSFMQTAVWTKNAEEGSPTNEETTFNDKDGLSIAVDLSLSYELIPDKIPAFYIKFRTEDLSTFTHGFMRNVARDAFNEVGVRYTAEEIYGVKKEEFLTKVRDRVNTEINKYGVNIGQFGVIGGMRLPQNVVSALNAKIEATQKAQQAENELRMTQAEAQKSIAQAEGERQSKVIKAQGEAEANRLLTASLSQQLLEWRQIEVQEKTLWRWDGKLPSTVVNGNTPMIMPGVK